MQSRIVRVCSLLLLGGLIFVGACRSDNSVYRQPNWPPTTAPAPVMVSRPIQITPPRPIQMAQVEPPPTVVPAQQEVRPLERLVWDANLKEQTPLPSAPTADFVFKVSNPSDMDVVISDVKTSCGCTVAKLPSKPWTLVPHTNGEIAVSVNLAGKSGTFYKTITVLSTNASKLLTIKVNLPQSPAMVRTLNQQLAMADPSKIFRDDCRKCHFDTAKSNGAPLMGKQLYVAVCGICHEAKPRATMVSDLHHLNHPTDYAFWKQIITDGKPRTMMPGFAVAHGGPLSDAQIDSLAKVLNEEFPSPAPTASAMRPIPFQPSKN